MKYLAIIPARGGSKGLPGKNLHLLLGKPLIAWTIETALQSNCIDRLIVSTDDPEIASVSVKYGAEVPFLRPDYLAADNSSTESALIHAVNWLQQNDNYSPDAVILLQCTSPIRAQDCLTLAVKQFESEQADSLLSVVPFSHFLWSLGPPVSALYNYKNRPLRQDILPEDVRFTENGSIYISLTKGLLETKNRLHGKISAYVMSAEEGFEIDTELDLAIVAATMSLKHGNSK